MKKPFSFANLLGGGQRSRAAAEDDEEEKTTPEEATEEEAEAEDEEEATEEEATEEDKDDSARRAVLADRKRIAKILGMATPDTVALAASLATSTDLTVEQVRAALAYAPKPAGGLAAAMRGRGAQPVAPSAGGASKGALPPELQAAQARRAKKER